MRGVSCEVRGVSCGGVMVGGVWCVVQCVNSPSLLAGLNNRAPVAARSALSVSGAHSEPAGPGHQVLHLRLFQRTVCLRAPRDSLYSPGP